MSHSTLVLTPWMSPHRFVPWQDAVLDYFQGKIDVLEEYDETISSAGSETNPKITIALPCVVRLRRAVNRNKQGVKFSRINVFTRDGFRCQYCGRQLDMKQLNYDHVIPRVQGGFTVWDNIVTSCYPCNSRKDRRTPEQAGMKLLRKPFKPTSLPMTAPIFNMPHKPHEKMLPYLEAATYYASVG